MSEIIGARQPKCALRITCMRSHEWNSEIIGLDWDGAVFATKFCPTCGLAGKRIPFTAEDIDHYLTDAQVRQIGEDAMPLYAWVYSQLIQLPEAEEKRMTFSLQTLVQAIFDSPMRVVRSIERLRALEYMEVNEIPKSQDKHRVEYFEDPAERRFTFCYGSKTRLIKLTDGAY